LASSILNKPIHFAENKPFIQSSFHYIFIFKMETLTPSTPQTPVLFFKENSNEESDFCKNFPFTVKCIKDFLNLNPQESFWNKIFPDIDVILQKTCHCRKCMQEHFK
jgi:hypothetical protein